ncbi:MAG: hypothetical protein K0Q73_3892 [Paenibacillus sp.]|jgi:uncharacterized damage-inducible protein DinB|nr:hypothetical protein [Paenibacillus sp.]
MDNRPNSNEYAPGFVKYIQLVPSGNLVETLQAQHDQSLALLQNLSEEKAAYRYAEGKWSLKTVVGHVADVERLFSYRVLRIARGDAREMPGYDRDIFAASASLEKVLLSAVLEDFSAVRKSTISLIRNLQEAALLRQGEFNGHPLSARAAAFIIAGHEKHHMNIIQERYLAD